MFYWIFTLKLLFNVMQYLVQTTFFIIGSYMRYIFLKDSHSLSLVMLLNAFKFTFPDIFGNYVLPDES